ncbi:hypothetical protein VZT92_009590 [Zoarces viviparus]|uniref:Uncharacterized protein n=1 Tax=Zoarces viviparus TaxID=48416 RepID=A0AAW1FC08_ZOAVI
MEDVNGRLSSSDRDREDDGKKNNGRRSADWKSSKVRGAPVHSARYLDPCSGTEGEVLYGGPAVGPSVLVGTQTQPPTHMLPIAQTPGMLWCQELQTPAGKLCFL